MMRVGSPPPSALEVVSVPSSSSASMRPLTPRSALAATYSTYVVRVHTRHGIKTISFDVLAAFFTYTAKKAAEDLGISSRTLIRVCRSLGIRRWPYLGFRSEKNVERIRQEAIENLRRKLERESSEAASSGSSSSSSSSAATHHAGASCLRGASAKRLLQVKLPSQAHASVPMARSAFERPSLFSTHATTSPSAPVNYHYHLQAQQQQHQSQYSPPGPSQSHRYTSAMPLLTPPPTHHAFNLDRMGPSVSPRRLPHVTSFRKHVPSSPPQSSSSSSACSSVASSPSSSMTGMATSTMPSLSVLLEASILTAFKHEVETHLARPTELTMVTDDVQHHARTMSMRDILNA